MIKKQAKTTVAVSQTDSLLVAGVPGRRIRVLSLAMEAAGQTATPATFNSKGSGAGVAISIPFNNSSNVTTVLPHNPDGWFETQTGEALTVTTGTGSATDLQIGYGLMQ